MSDRIEKQVELNAPVSRVWRAITDYREFGEWFLVKLDGPFELGRLSRGNITYPGYEYIIWEALVQTMEPERLFAFTWAHPKSMDRATYSSDYSNEPRTLVEFRLQPAKNGTLLQITESGFDALPEDRRVESYQRNDGGWTEQVKNIQAYLAKQP